MQMRHATGLAGRMGERERNAATASAHESHATGRDLFSLLPVLAAVFSLAASTVLPWFMVPSIMHAGLPYEFSVHELTFAVSSLFEVVFSDGAMPFGSASLMKMWGDALHVLGILSACLMVVAGVAAWRFRARAVALVQACFAASCLAPCTAIGAYFAANACVNDLLGIVPTLLTMTVKGPVQLTYVPMAQLLLGIGIAQAAPRLLDTHEDVRAGEYYPVRLVQRDAHMGRRTRASLVLMLVVMPLLMLFGVFVLGNRSQVFIGLCMCVVAMVPFAMVFEDRRPQARELILIAVMVALAVAGRMAFFMIPQFKPVSALVIIAGVWLGPETGFLVGTMSGFVSNFFFGQGPWTPWQMLGFGCMGFLAGVLFRRGGRPRVSSTWALCAFGFVAIMLVYEPLVNTSSVLQYMGSVSWTAALAIYAAGVPFGVMHAISTVIFLGLLAKPMGKKLERVQKKYGVFEA